MPAIGITTAPTYSPPDARIKSLVRRISFGMNAVSKPIRTRIRQWARDLLLLAAILLVVIFPSPAFQAALRGMELFLFTVAPGLIPFLILCPLFLKTKLFHRIADEFSRFSSRLFRCGGACGPLFLMGCLSGFPAGARFVRDAYAAGQITRGDSLRAICFCNVCGPLFMLGAVGAGMFANTACGWILSLAHYAAAILTGVVMARIPVRGISRTLSGCVPALEKDPSRSFLSSLGVSVQAAMQTILLVGGYIILGSVAVRLADVCGIWGGLYALIRPVAYPLGFTAALFKGTAAGVIEISGGCMRIAQSASPLWIRLSLCAFILGFSGFAIIGQVTALWEGYDLPLGRYLTARLIQGGIAALLSGAAAILLPADRLAVAVTALPQPPHAKVDGVSYILLCAILVGFVYILYKKKTR